MSFKSQWLFSPTKVIQKVQNINKVLDAGAIQDEMSNSRFHYVFVRMQSHEELLLKIVIELHLKQHVTVNAKLTE